MAQSRPQESPLRVLVFDNSSDILELLSTDLQCRGCIVTTGSVSAIRHGEIDGPHLIEAAAPDVIVFDVALPYEANWQIAMNLQADPRVRVPFVLTTTNAMAVRRLIGRDLIELVGKPYDLDTLYDVILRRRRQTAPRHAIRSATGGAEWTVERQPAARATPSSRNFSRRVSG